MNSIPSTRNKSIKATTMLGLLIFAIAIGLFIPEVTFAQSVFESFGDSVNLANNSLPVVIGNLIRAALGVLGIIVVVIIVYAGFVWMTSAGNPDRIARAKKTLRNAAIGLLIILASWAITTFILGIFGGDGNQGSVVDVADKYNEPLAGALGAGILDNHYPPRNALDIPRNTKVFVTFKEAINQNSIIETFDPLTASGPLIDGAVDIFETADTNTVLSGADVTVIAVPDFSGGLIDPVTLDPIPEYFTFVFDPEPLLGSPNEDVNHTVRLNPVIEKANGSNAFTGVYGDGYEWTFEVDTNIDLDPPTIVDIFPIPSSVNARNVAVMITFDEAMDPTRAVSALQAPNNIPLKYQSDNSSIAGNYKEANAYKTVVFTTDVQCASDPCGNPVYCFNPNETIDVEVNAAPVDPNNPPQADLGAGFFGLTDASGNSLDADDNDIAGDGTSFSFSVTDELDTSQPHIGRISPGINGSNIRPDELIEIEFKNPILSSTANTSNVQLWPDVQVPDYSIWFSLETSDDNRTVYIDHPPFISKEDGGYGYYPVVTHDLRGANQFCMYPALGPSQAGIDISPPTCAVSTVPANSAQPYCCNGQPSAIDCQSAGLTY